MTVLCKHHYLSGKHKGKRCRQTAKYPVRNPVVCQYHRKYQRQHHNNKRGQRSRPPHRQRRSRQQLRLQQQRRQQQRGAGLWSALFGGDDDDNNNEQQQAEKIQEIQKQEVAKKLKAKPKEVRAVNKAVNQLVTTINGIKKKPPQLQPFLDPVITAVLKRAIDNILRRVFQLIRIGGATGGVIASLGFGGDTIVDIILLLLPVAKLGVDLAWAAKNPLAKKLVTIDFEGGLDAVEAKTEKILADIQKDKEAKRILKQLCVEFQGILGSVSSTFGQIVTAFIPDDFGLAGTAAEEIIVTAGSDSYPLLRAFYDKMPELARELLENKKKLAKFINTVLDLLVKKDEKWWQQLARGGVRGGLISAASLAGLGIALGSTVVFPPALPIVIAVGAGAQAGNLLFTAGIGDDTTRKLVDEVLRPRIPISVEVISRSVALAFVTLRVLAEC
jgi:hypothetical protein